MRFLLHSIHALALASSLMAGPAEERQIRDWTTVASRGGDIRIETPPDGLLESWLNLNGESLFGVSASPLRSLPWGRCTMKTSDTGVTLYFHILDWPNDGVLRVPGLDSNPSRIQVLWTGAQLDWKRRDEGLEIGLPLAQLDPLCTVLRVDLAGPLNVVDVVVRPAKDGRFTLPALLAELNSPDPDVALRVERTEPRARHNIGRWNDPQSWVKWTLKVNEPATYDIALVFANPAEHSRLRVQSGAQRIDTTLGTTGSSDIFRTAQVGRIRFEQAGLQELSLRPVPRSWYPLNVRDVLLKPTR